jgi:hypothetical protein
LWHESRADIAAIRDSCQGTVVRTAPITLEDLDDFIPIGPMIAKGTITGRQLKTRSELQYLSCLPNRTTTPEPRRLNLFKPIAAASFGSLEIQRWRGAAQSTKNAKASIFNLPTRRAQCTNEREGRSQ